MEHYLQSPSFWLPNLLSVLQFDFSWRVCQINSIFIRSVLHSVQNFQFSIYWKVKCSGIWRPVNLKMFTDISESCFYHLERNPRQDYSWSILITEAGFPSDMSVTICQSTRRRTPEGFSLYQGRRENPKSHNVHFLSFHYQQYSATSVNSRIPRRVMVFFLSAFSFLASYIFVGTLF